MKFFHLIILTCFLSLTSCFTGIESTPRISDKEVRRNVPAVDAEKEFSLTLAAQPVQQWETGHRFMVTDSKMSLIFEKEPALEYGDLLTFKNLSPEISITGDTISVLTFVKSGNIRYLNRVESDRENDDENSGNTTPRRKIRAMELRYKVNISPDKLSPTFTLPMSVDLDMVANVSEKLKGKELYVISSLRVDSLLTPTATGQRYVPVTISEVAPGNADYPLRVQITDAQGNKSYVAMTVGTARSSTRNFDKLFVLDNPRLKHPAITDAVWNNIINSRVVTGMTIDECYLALGTPRDIRKWHNGGSFFEGWTYDNGRYLIFEDAILSVIH